MTKLQLIRTAYVACHKQDVEWILGERVEYAEHAFRTTGYDLADITYFAAGQSLVVLRVAANSTLQPVI